MSQNISDVKAEVQAVLARLKVADAAYYDAAATVSMEDEEYDALKESLSSLVDRLRDYDFTDPLLKQVELYTEGVGATPSAGVWKKSNHQIRMNSLNKQKGVGGIKIWFDKISSI